MHIYSLHRHTDPRAGAVGNARFKPPISGGACARAGKGWLIKGALQLLINRYG